MLINTKTITLEDKDIYDYGVRQGILILTNIATTLIIGLLFNMVLETIIFMLAYIPLRSYAGGYHAKTPIRCYIFSIFLIIVALWWVNIIPLSGIIYLIFAICSTIIIAGLAPVENENKPLDLLEKRVYKKRARILLGALVLVSIILWAIGLQKFSASVIVGLMILAVMLILGKVKLVARSSR